MLGCWLGSAAIAAALPMHYLGRTAAAGEFLALTLALVPLSLAVVVNRRAPDHPAGAVLAAAGLCWVIAFIPSDVEAGVFGGTWMLLYLPCSAGPVGCDAPIGLFTIQGVAAAGIRRPRAAIWRCSW